MARPAQTFGDLGVWQKAHALVLEVYSLTKRLPKDELFGLTSQMRRSAVSVPANIAEGSLEELRYFFILCADLAYLPMNPVADRLDEVARMLGAYTQAILDSRS